MEKEEHWNPEEIFARNRSPQGTKVPHQAEGMIGSSGQQRVSRRLSQAAGNPFSGNIWAHARTRLAR